MTHKLGYTELSNTIYKDTFSILTSKQLVIGPTYFLEFLLMKFWVRSRYFAQVIR